jgi:PKHD-type hydroxylase
MPDPHALPGLFSAAECEAIIALADSRALLEARLVGGRDAPQLRRARLAWLDDDGPAAWVFARLAQGVARANRESFGAEVESFDERAQAALYPAETAGAFGWHSDIGEGPLARRRKLTVVVQLSDPADYAGGALELNPDGAVRAADRARGAAVVFPSFVLHRVAPVTRGARWSLTLWAHGSPYR